MQVLEGFAIDLAVSPAPMTLVAILRSISILLFFACVSVFATTTVSRIVFFCAPRFLSKAGLSFAKVLCFIRRGSLCSEREYQHSYKGSNFVLSF